MYKFLAWDYDRNISQTIKGKQFADFLDLCFERSVYFSLMKGGWMHSVNDSIEKELDPFLIKELKMQKWYGYDLSGCPEPTQRFLEVNIYGANIEAKAVLLKYFGDIFLNERKGEDLVDSTQTLEDLCFYSKNSLWVGTVSHEDMLHVYLSSDESQLLLSAYGTWEYGEDAQTDRLNAIESALSTL